MRFLVWSLLLLMVAACTPGSAQTTSGPPAIVTQPQSVSPRSGDDITLSVAATGSMPLLYQWRFNQTPIPGATNASLRFPSIHFTNSGAYQVVVNNSFGVVTSAVATVSVDDHLFFRVLELRTNSVVAIDSYPIAGYDLGVLAAGSNYVLATGTGPDFNNISARFSAADLSGGAGLGATLYALVSNLRTEKIYSLGSGATPISFANYQLNFTNVTSLLEIDENTGTAVRMIPLSAPIRISTGGNIGIFAGYDRIVIHGAYVGNGYHVYNIALPSGVVTDLGTMSIPQHQYSDGWAYWGIAEYAGGRIHLVYARDFTTIVRRTVPSGATSEVGVFNNLGNMAMLAFSTSRSRWYFRTQGSSQFGNFFETMGTGKATFSTDPRFPTILQDPIGRQAYVESNVVLSVSATGEEPLEYQWFLNQVELPDATNSILAINNVQPTNSGIYTVRVRNRLGEVMSGRGILDVVWLPRILQVSSDRSVFPGTNVTFTVITDGAPPMEHQWYLNNVLIPGATRPVLMLSNIQASAGGFYTLAASNRFGRTVSRAIELNVVVPVDDGGVFEITTLGITGVRTIDSYRLFNEYQYGPLAASSNSLFSSSFNTTLRVSLDDLGGAAQVNGGDGRYMMMLSNLRTETAYALGTDNGPFEDVGGTLTTLWELHPTSGVMTGRRITLSSSIPNVARSTQVGLFAGYDEAIILNGSRAYRIAFSGGVVENLGPMFPPTHYYSWDGPFWGVAEHFGGVRYIVYVKNNRTIARARVPDGVEVAAFPFTNLPSTMASITVSIRRNRWYFHHTSSSQFVANNIDTLGYAVASFRIRSGPVPDHFDFAPIYPLQAAGEPFPITIFARNSDNQITTNFNGSASLRGFNAVGGAGVQVLPASASNFVAGVWTGLVVVPQPVASMYLRAENPFEGLAGNSSTFAVNTSNDLALVVFDSPDPVVVGHALTHTVVVTNYGPAAASAVILTNTLPASANFVSVTASQGACTNEGNVIVCDLGTIAGGSSSLITVVSVPTVAGVFTNRATIIRGEADANPTNNAATSATSVALPVLSVSDTSIVEGNSDSNVTFTITLTPPVPTQVSATYSTLNFTANPTDYFPTSGQIVFEGGSTSQIVTVSVRGDIIYENNEVFALNLNTATGATIGTGRGNCTIINDDVPPFVFVSDATLVEGNSGTNNMTFRISLSTNAGVPVIVNYTTSNGTAVAGSDYLPRSGQLNFLAGTSTLTQNVNVQILGEVLGERDETVHLVLTTITNGTAGRAVGTGTIINEDGMGMLDHFAWSIIPSPQIAGQPMPVSIAALDTFDSLMTNFNGSVRLSAEVPQPPVIAPALGNITHLNSFSGGFFTIGYFFVPTNDIRVIRLRSYSGTKVSIWNDAGVLLLSQPVASNPGAWSETTLAVPLELSDGNTYRIGFYGGDETYYYSDFSPGAFQHGFIGAAIYAQGDAFPTIELGSGLYLVDFVYSVETPALPILLSPTQSVTFANGTWTGNVNVLEGGTNVVLRAADSAQHTGLSNPFNVVAVNDADLGVSIAMAPNPCRLTTPVSYTVMVTNRGPATAASVVLSNFLPAGFNFISADPSQGAWTNDGEGIVVFLGDIPANRSAVMTIEAVADAPGTNSTWVKLANGYPDPNPYNNSARLVSIVYVDRDSDGIADDWEQRNNLRSDDPDDAELDPDLDGHNNTQEFLAGTDPRDPQSVLRVTRLTAAGQDLRITFRGIRGKRYRLERMDQPGGAWSSVLEFRAGSAQNIDLLDPGAATRPLSVYRIRLIP